MKQFLLAQWAKFAAWIQSHGGYTKVGAAVIILLGLAYGSVPEFHALCIRFWGYLPTSIKTLIVTLSALYAWFRNPATRKIIDSVLGPGDEVTMQHPVMDTTSNILSADSATIRKADPPDA